MIITKQTRAESYLLLITLIWGSTFVVTKFVLQDAGPFLYTSIRFLLATLIFGIVFFPKLRTIGKQSALNGAFLGFLLFVGFASQTVGLLYTTASKSAFITGMMVAFTPLCQLAIERKAPKVGNLIGVALVMAGLYFLTSPTGSHFNLGDGLTLICALSFAIYIVYLDIFSQNCEASHLTIMQFAVTAALASLSFLFFEDFHLVLSTGFVVGVVYLAIFATVIALFVQARYQKDTTPTRSAVVFSVEPVIAAIVAYLVLGERLGDYGILGAALIMTGVAVSEFSDFIFKATRTVV
jgi:drug/metabolite transporter (DMT)-like permease